LPHATTVALDHRDRAASTPAATGAWRAVSP
jgi:hypothetical protein